MKGVKSEFEVDPLDELNELDETFTIETEKDYFDELENVDSEKLPEYDSQKGKLLDAKKEVKQPKIDLMEEIDKVAVKHAPVESDEPKKAKGEKRFKPKRLSNKSDEKDETKRIDNVKVDEDGVPLLNQFDMDKIKDKTVPRFTIRRISLSKLILIVVGVIITFIGIIQAMNDVVKISDHVMYGEHESIAMGLILLGVIMIVLAFYREIMHALDLNNIAASVDDTGSSMPKTRKNTSNKKSKKKS